MINATEIKKGIIIKLDNELYEVVNYQHITPGNWRAMVQSKLRNIKTNSTKEQRFRSTDRIEVINVEQVPAEFLYKQGNDYIFMNHTNYEEITLTQEILGDAVAYFTSNLELLINYYEGAPVGVQLPMTVDLKVTQTAPPLKTATITNVHKPATLENGLVVPVPSFVETGETIRIDTRDGHYVERVK